MCLAFVGQKAASSRVVAEISAYLFAVHPVHAEAVTGVVGRAELLSSVFFLMAILAYKKAAVKSQHGHLVTSMAFVAFAMLCKEQGITVLGILAIYDLVMVQRLQLQLKMPSFNWPLAFRLVIVIVTGILLLLLRFIVMGHTLPVFTNFDNPASYADPPVKQLTWAYLLSGKATILGYLWPFLTSKVLLFEIALNSAVFARNLTTFFVEILLFFA